MVLAKKWILSKQFDGFPKAGNLVLETEELPEEIKDGEILCEAIYLTVDPYMRAHEHPVGSVMAGQQVAKITVSKHSDWPVGSLVLGYFGWRSHTLLDADVESTRVVSFYAPNLQRLTSHLGELSPSYAVGALGMPGATAYLGTFKILQPKEGDVLLVNAAAGAVGSIVGQIGKIKGCKVIGCAGTQEKCKWLKDLGFDHVINYKTDDVNKELQAAAPEGIDCYFDNVGGKFTTDVITTHMKLYGRVAFCGSISNYNSKPDMVPAPWYAFIHNQIKAEGFIVYRWFSEFQNLFKDMAQWIKEGKIQTREHVTEGFENMEKAFMGLFTGDNTGKAIVKV